MSTIRGQNTAIQSFVDFWKMFILGKPLKKYNFTYVIEATFVCVFQFQ